MSSHTCCVSRTDTTWSPTPGTWLWMLLLPQPTDISFTPVHLTFKKFRLYPNVLPNPFQTTHQWPEFLPKMQVNVQAPIKVPELQSCHPTITFITWWEPRRLSCLPDCPNYFPQSVFFFHPTFSCLYNLTILKDWFCWGYHTFTQLSYILWL